MSDFQVEFLRKYEKSLNSIDETLKSIDKKLGLIQTNMPSSTIKDLDDIHTRIDDLIKVIKN